MKKVCKKCEVEKELTDFSRDRTSSTGWTSACKKCRRIQCDNWTVNNKARVRAMARKRYYKNRVRMINYSAKWKANNMDKVRQHDRNRVAKDPNKPRARRVVKFAVDNGKLQQSPCEVCGDKDVQAHHDSYIKKDWLKVRWMCKFHHIKHHKELRRKARE